MVDKNKVIKNDPYMVSEDGNHSKFHFGFKMLTVLNGTNFVGFIRRLFGINAITIDLIELYGFEKSVVLSNVYNFTNHFDTLYELEIVKGNPFTKNPLTVVMKVREEDGWCHVIKVVYNMTNFQSLMNALGIAKI